MSPGMQTGKKPKRVEAGASLDRVGAGWAVQVTELGLACSLPGFLSLCLSLSPIMYHIYDI